MRNRNRLTVRALVIGFLGIGIFPATYVANSDATPTSTAALQEVGTVVTAQGRTKVNFYETPCELRERTQRGIPAPSLSAHYGENAWVLAHLDGNTPDALLADYWAALDACDRYEPVAQWNWGGRVVVNVEYIGN